LIEMRTACTIGYERRSLDELVAMLCAARIERVIDVRALPLSRRRGFSKTPLGTALGAAGIEYVHLRAAGNPFRDQRADIERCLALYEEFLADSPDVIEAVLAELRGRRGALLCVERDASACHRSVIARALAKRAVRIRDL
jgi:uncharacterized protein (DUF488 family)